MILLFSLGKAASLLIFPHRQDFVQSQPLLGLPVDALRHDILPPHDVPHKPHPMHQAPHLLLSPDVLPSGCLFCLHFVTHCSLQNTVGVILLH